jgi:hypothetical protein
MKGVTVPKLFPIHIEVEELAVGRVMRVLNSLDGVAKLHLDLDRDKAVKPNGAGEPRGPYKTRKQPVTLAETGDETVIKALFAKSPLTVPQLRDLFVAQGRSPKSISSVLHKLKQDGEVLISDDGYMLTKKARDRMRHKVSRKSRR